MEERQKASFNMVPRAKNALENLKVRLRRAGVARSVASESAILEALIFNADFDWLLEKLGK
jgi:hypothetical protein